MALEAKVTRLEERLMHQALVGRVHSGGGGTRAGVLCGCRMLSELGDAPDALIVLPDALVVLPGVLDIHFDMARIALFGSYGLVWMYGAWGSM